ncbi:hypothetical protein GA0061091_1261 [Gordonia sp. v-85]|nr:hypothetical protein GA0061091_1261 [Gordonia sp. v-85]
MSLHRSDIVVDEMCSGRCGMVPSGLAPVEIVGSPGGFDTATRLAARCRLNQRGWATRLAARCRLNQRGKRWSPGGFDTATRLAARCRLNQRGWATRLAARCRLNQRGKRWSPGGFDTATRLAARCRLNQRGWATRLAARCRLNQRGWAPRSDRGRLNQRRVPARPAATAQSCRFRSSDRPYSFDENSHDQGGRPQRVRHRRRRVVLDPRDRDDH